MSLLSDSGNPYTQEKSCNVMCSLTGVSIGVLFAGLVVTQLQIHGLVPAYLKSEKTEILHIIDEKMKQSSNCEVTKTDESGQVIFSPKILQISQITFSLVFTRMVFIFLP